MENQLCPKCNANLEDNNNVIFTDESAIFKGHNVYMVCRNCGYVMVYNKDRSLIFNIDKYQDDQDVLMEIEQLINKVDSHYTLDLDERPVCNGNCNVCNQCDNVEETKEEEEQEVENIKEETVIEEQEVQQEESSQFSIDILKEAYLLVHNESGQAQLIKLEELKFVSNLDDFTLFALEEVMVEPIVSFKVHKKN